MKVKMFLLVILAISFTVGGSIFVVEYRNFQSLRMSFEEGQEYLFGFTHDSIEFGLANGSLEFAQTTLERLQTHSTFAGATIFDPDLTSLLTLPSEFSVPEDVLVALLETSTITDGQMQYQLRPLLDEDGETTGYLAVNFDLSPLRDEFRDALLLGLFVGVLIAVPIIFAIMREVSKRVIVEEQLRSSAEVLESQTERLKKEITVRENVESKLIKAKQVAESATDARSMFLANMSHEIRTPMNGIIGFTNLALKTELSREQRNFLNKIRVSAEALLSLINDILDFTKIDAGKMDVEQTEFELQSVLEDLGDLFAHRAAEKDIELIIARERNVPSALIGDPLRLRQILVNITSNAIKFTEHGEILIRVKVVEEKEKDDSLLFIVRDSGIGISEENLLKLFTPFTQADGSTTRRFGGTGLGLAISQELVHLMGGNIDVQSRLGEGTTFTFSLPLMRQADDAVHTYRVSVDLRGMKTLLVDDSATSREVISEMLNSFGFQVTSVESGKEGLEKLNGALQDHTPYELILVDWKMPEMDGIEFSDHVRNGSAEIQVPIVMITAFGGESEMRQVTDIGINAFLTKPIQQSILFNTLMEVFGKTDLDRGEQERQLLTKESMSSAGLVGLRVLLAEDNVINQELAVRLLEDVGIIVDVAENGREAVEKVKDTDYAAVLMDMQMPELDGYEATQIIRNEIRNVGLPIIAMTAHAMQGDREKCLEAGMNDYLSKPINPNELFSLLAKWTEPIEMSPERRTATLKSPTVEQDIIPAIQNLPGFNIEEGLRRCSGDPKLYIKLLNNFSKQYLHIADEIRKALEEDRLERAREIVHTLKGLSGNLAATELYRVSKSLEEALKEENSNAMELRVGEVQEEMGQVLESIRILNDSRQDLTQDGPAIDIDPTDSTGLGDMLKDLSRMLSEQDAFCEDILQPLEGSLKAMGFAQETQKLKTFMDDFAFDEAGAIVEEIQARLRSQEK